VEFRILGPLEVWHGGALVPVRGSKQRALLAVLVLHANEVVSTDRLMDALWGSEVPDQAALRVRVSQLRKALGAGGETIVTQAPGYRLGVEDGALDLHRFEELVANAPSDEPAVAAERLREALELWRGPPLAEFEYEEFAQPAIARLEELRLAAVEKRIDADLALGCHADVIPELEALAVDHD